MRRAALALLQQTIAGFLADGAVGRGAAIAYYTVFSIAPILVIAIAVAGLAFGETAVRGAIAEELADLLGPEAAQAVQTMVRGAANRTNGVLATALGVATLVLGASAVFGELQQALNHIWRVPPRPNLRGAVAQYLRARAAGVGLVLATGFLLSVSLVASTALVAVGTWAGHLLPMAQHVLALADAALSFLLVAALFAAIYKVLPDRRVAWADVAVGALLTAALFTVGKNGISWYVGSSGFASTYGAAGAVMVLLLWVYYSAQILLLGAEFTKAWATQRGR